jgi:succinoglycan biosynthesis transport protein ExoP
MASSELDIKKYLDLLFRHKKSFIMTALAIMTGAVLLSYALPKEYEAKSVVFIEKNIMGELVKGLAVSPSIEDKVKVLTYAMASRTLLLKVFDDLDMNIKKMNDKQIEELIKETQKKMEVKTKEKEGLFLITFRNDNPKFARDFVNTLIRRYIEENVAAKREDAYGANTFLTEQITVFKQNLDKADDKISSFRQGANSMANISEGDMFKAINDGQNRLDQLHLRLQQLEQSRAEMQGTQPLLPSLRAAEKRLAELRVQYNDSYPDVIKLKAEIDSLKEQIRAGSKNVDSPSDDSQQVKMLDAEIKRIKEFEANTRRQIATYQSQLNRIPEAKQNLEELEREKSQSRNIYEALMTRQSQSELSKQMEIQDKTSNFRVVDPAVVPVEPVSPNRVRIILIGIAAGLACGFGLVLLFDSLDTSVKSVSSIKALGVPLLGVIPRMENIQDLLLQKKRDFRLYNISGAYFSLVIVILIMETLKISVVDSMFAAINFQQNVAMLRNKIMSLF